MSDIRQFLRSVNPTIHSDFWKTNAVKHKAKMQYLKVNSEAEAVQELDKSHFPRRPLDANILSTKFSFFSFSGMVTKMFKA